MARPILCVDFDGVIHSYTSGWSRADEIRDPPVPGAMAFLAEASKYFDVCIYSSRSHQVGGIEAMMKFIWEHGSLELAKKLKYPMEKPSAKVTLDDRAITFTGIFPAMEQLLSFQPWNKIRK